MQDHSMCITTVVGIQPLPGTIAYQGQPFREIISDAVAQAETYFRYGIRSIIIQNVNDWPSKTPVGQETVAYMSVIGNEIRRAIGADCAIGISVLRNDGPAAVAIAHAIGAQFVRAKVYVGAMLGAVGIETGCMNEVLSLRHAIGSDVEIWADIRSRTAAPLADYSIAQECEFAAGKGLCTHFILSGQTVAESLSLMQSVKAKFPKCNVILGGGANAENLRDICAAADGVIVASCLREGGKMHNALDPKRLQDFMDMYNTMAM